MSPTRRELALLLGVALGARLLAAWALGEGAPFGPDGTGIEAAVALGGHRYPLHIAAVDLLGGARRLSVISGSLSCALLWDLGRRRGLGPTGGWLLALLPVHVYVSALSAGDAPALFVVLFGAWLASLGRLWSIPGGAVALASVAVKPVALPALVLLGAGPLAWLGVVLAWPWYGWWLSPLHSPKPGGGLLGTWWSGTGGELPADLPAWLAAGGQGLLELGRAPLWVGGLFLGLALLHGLLGSISRRRSGSRPRLRRPPEGGPAWSTVLAYGLGPFLAGVAVASALGDALQPRYLEAAVVAALPLAGWLLPRLSTVLLLVPCAALITQVASERAERDTLAEVPVLPVQGWPTVDAAPLFEESSTDGATALRQEAARLAQTLPEGATITVTRRPHGREGELTWPLMVARPDVHIERVDP